MSPGHVQSTNSSVLGESTKEDSQDELSFGKERTTRARSAAAAVVSTPLPVEVPSPVLSTTTTPALRKSRAESTSSRQRNKSGQPAETKNNKEHNSADITGLQQPQRSQPAASPTKPKGEPGKPLSREDRKLESVLRLIERMESNEKKKEIRQSQKKGKGNRKGDDLDTDHDIESDHHGSNASAAAASTPTGAKSVKFIQAQKKKGKKRGRSGSHSSPTMAKGKPQMISQRSSGSGGDMRTTSTESEIISADEGGRESPMGDSSFRLPKTKRVSC